MLSKIFPKFDRYFNGHFLVKCARYVYICNQRVKISKNRHFVFGFTSLPVLTVFSTFILTRSWWRRTLICNPKPSNPRRYPHTKFQENKPKLWPWQCHRFIYQDGRRDVINYVNEPKHKRSYSNPWVYYAWKVSFGQLE